MDKFIILLLLFVSISSAYQAKETTEILSQFYGRRITRDDSAIDNFFENGLTKRQDYPIPYYPDPNPEAISLNGSKPLIKIGYVVTDFADYRDNLYQGLGYAGLSILEYMTNSGSGVLINGTQYAVDIVAYNSGPTCPAILLAYQRLILVDKVNVIINPVSEGCVEVALLAEFYQIPSFNGLDFTLDYLMLTTSPFNNLRYSYSLTGSSSSLGIGCLVPLADLGAKSYATFYDPQAFQNVIPAVKAAASSLKMYQALNDTLLSAASQADAVERGQNCSYLWPLIDKIIEVKPDVLIGFFGALYTDTFVDCMHRRGLYRPPGLWLIAGSTFSGQDLWQSDWSMSLDLWVARSNLTDPFLVSTKLFNTTYARQFGTRNLAQVSYAASNAVAGGLALSAISQAGSLLADDILAILPGISFQSIIGEIYLETGTHRFHHDFYCIQRQNDSNPVGLPIYPYNVFGVTPAQYPGYINPPQSFLDSLREDNSLSRQVKFGIIFGSISGFLLLVIIIVIVIVLIVSKRYRAIFIPKVDEEPESQF